MCKINNLLCYDILYIIKNKSHNNKGDKMLYINYLFVYSVFGFIMESVIYKVSNSNSHSGIFYGPYTFVYGFGVLISILIYEYLEKKIKHKNKYFKIFLYFLIFTIILTLVEYIGGNILKMVFDIDMWDYSNKRYHFGKYICLSNALIWGLLGTFNIYLIYPKLKKLLKKVPSIYTISIVLIFLVDLFLTILFKFFFQILI